MAIELLAGERKENETDRAVQACNAYLRLGSSRTLPKLLKKPTKSNQDSPATDSLGTLKQWSSDYEWQQRASLYDAGLEVLRNEKRRKEFETGLALDYERVGRLKRLAMFLERQIYAGVKDRESGVEIDDEAIFALGTPYPNVWLRDVKQIGGGEFATKVELVRFNSAIIEQYRNTLDDLAREVGDRKQRQELSGIVTTVNVTSDDMAKARERASKIEAKFLGDE